MEHTYTMVLAAGRFQAGTDGAGCCLAAQQQIKAYSLGTYCKGNQEVLCPSVLQLAVLSYAKATHHSLHGEVSQH